MIDSDPCAAQKAVMESLGFTSAMTSDSSLSHWHCGGIELVWGNGFAPDAGAVMRAAIREALCVGELRKANAIKKLLHIA